MSQPRDRRVVSGVEGSILGGSQTSTSSPPQVTLEPITSFKRSLEEIGFDTGPGDELVQALTSTSTHIPRMANPMVIADRGYAGTPDISTGTPEVTSTSDNTQSSSSMSAQLPGRSLGAAARSILAGRRSSVATPPLLPPISSQQSHLLELISDFSPESEYSRLQQQQDGASSADTPGSSSTSENEVFLATTRRPDPLRLPLNEVRQRAANATPTTPSSWSSSTATPSATPLTRRLFRNTSTQQRTPTTPGSTRHVGGTITSSAGPSQPRFSFEESVSSQRSPELPPIDTSDNGLGGLSSLLYTESSASSSTASDVPQLQASSGTSNSASRNTAAFLPGTRTFLPARPFVESPSPPISAAPAATIASTLGEGWEERAARFEEAIAPLRLPHPPQQQLPSRLDTRFRSYLPHPFEEIMSPSTPGESDDNASEFSWEDQRDAYRYIRDLNTVIDERETESGELTPVLTIPMLPPIVPSPLLVVDGGLSFEEEVPNPTMGHSRLLSEEETEWEADEVPSAWLREARRHLGRPITSSTGRESGAPPPLLELPNFSSTSLGLVDFPNSGANANVSATNNASSHPEVGPQPTNVPAVRTGGAIMAPSRDVLRRLSTEHLRQLRRVAIRSVASRSLSRSSMAPSVISSDGDASRVSDVRPESVVSNEDIVVGVPPVLDESFDRSVWRALEDRMQQSHHHAHFRPPAATPGGSRDLPALDIRRQPRVSLGPLSSGLHFDGDIMGSQRDTQNDAAANPSVRPAVPSSSSASTTNGDQTDSELGEWRQLVEGSLSSQAVPPLALSPPPASNQDQSRPSASGNPHWRMRRLEQIRSASSMSGDSGNTRFTSQSLRQTVNDYREGRLSEAQLENSLGVAMLEMRAEMESAASSGVFVVNPGTHLHAADPVSLSSPQPLRRTAEAEAFQLLDSVWSNSNSATVQGMSREMEFMERSLLERSAEVIPRRSHSPLWDTDDPLSEFLSDVGFDGSYEALMELSEQLGVVSRGMSEAAFGALRTVVFKDLEPHLEPGIGPLSPTLSTISQNDFGSGDLAASMSPTLASFSSPRIRRARTGKWVAQCSICLEEYAPDDVCVTLDCTHFFHQPCVRQWFVSVSTCPLCRHPLPRN